MPYIVGQEQRSIGVADFDADGVLDFAVANYDDDDVSVLLGHGDGTFAFAFDLRVGNRPGALSTGDVNADGAIDLVVAHQGDDYISVFIGAGDGTFAPEVQLDIGPGARSMVLCDLDTNGTLDIVYTDRHDDEVVWMSGHGDGSFGEPVRYAGADPWELAVGRLNADAAPDVVAVSYTQNVVLVLLNQCGGACLADLDGSLDVGTSDLLALIAAWGACPECAADFDGDGAVGVADLLTLLGAWGPCAPDLP